MSALIPIESLLGSLTLIGLTIIGGIGTLIYRSWSNAAALERVEETLDQCDVRQMKAQVDELWLDRRETWRYLRERGDLEALHQGYARRNSPIDISGLPHENELIQLYRPFIPELIKIEKEIGGDENILFEAVAKRLGETFVKEVCPKIRADKGACVSIALAVLNKYKKEQGQC